MFEIKKYLVFITIFICGLFYNNTLATTTVTKDTTWSGTVIIKDNVVINPLVKLTIKPGTKVKFDGNYSITVNGALFAEGTSSNKIIFTSNKSNPKPNDWNRIEFTAQSGYPKSSIKNCVFEFANTALYLNNIIDVYELSIEECKFLYTYEKSIFINNSHAIVKNDSIYNFRNYGIYTQGNNTELKVNNSVFTQQEPSKIRQGTGIYVYWGGKIDIYSSTFNLLGNGIYIHDQNNYPPKSTMNNNVITQNNVGVKVDGGYTYPDVTVENNDIYDNISWNTYIGGGYNPTTNEMDFKNNWWGTDDGVEIASKIYDNSDNDAVAFVNYLPFLDAKTTDGGKPTSKNYIANWVHENMTWTKNGSPYVVIGRVIIADNRTLVIEAGTVIKFESNNIEVRGQLLVRGRSSEKVLMTSNKETPTPGDWGGIVLNTTSNGPASEINYLRMEYVQQGITVNNINTINSIKFPKISNITIENSMDKGIYVTNSKININNIIIKDYIGYGIYVTGPLSEVEITGGSITQQLIERRFTGTGIFGDNGSNVTISGLTISLSDIGIYANNTSSGMQYNPKPTFTIYNNVIQNNKKGLYSLAAWHLPMTSLYKADYPKIDATNNDMYNNSEWNVYIDKGANPATTELNFQNNWWGTDDSASIGTKIYDYYDNNSVAKVEYNPFSQTNVANYGVADINKDGRTDGYDLTILASTFGLSTGQEGYKEKADLNGSNRVDGFDLAILGIHFGEYGIGLLPKAYYADPDTNKIIVMLDYNKSELSMGDTLFAKIKLKNSKYLFAFATDIEYNKDNLEFIGLKNGDIIYDEDNKISELYSVNNGKGTLGISRIGKQDSIEQSSEGVLVGIYFLVKNNHVTNDEIKLKNIGFIAPDSSEYEYILDEALTGISSNSEIPDSYHLYQNYPNPFNPSTNIKFCLPQSTLVTITIFDALGRKIKTLEHKYFDAGMHSVKFNSSGLASGIYYYSLRSRNYSATKKMLLLK